MRRRTGSRAALPDAVEGATHMVCDVGLSYSGEAVTILLRHVGIGFSIAGQVVVAMSSDERSIVDCPLAHLTLEETTVQRQ